MAEPLLWDRSENVRWQAAIVIGLFIETNPDEVWRVLCEHEHRGNKDAVGMFGCVLLEDLLWTHFERYWNRVEERSFHAGSAMGQWVSMMSRGSTPGRRWNKVLKLKARMKPSSRRS